MSIEFLMENDDILDKKKLTTNCEVCFDKYYNW